MKVKKYAHMMKVVAVCLAFSVAANADVPELMSFQGMLSDADGVPLTGMYSVQFSVYTSQTNGTQLWTETQSIDVNEGFFDALLGSVNPVTCDIFSEGTTTRYLGIKVGSDDEMTPRQRIGTVAYAFAAQNLGPGVVNVDPNGDVGIGTRSPGVISGASQYLTVTTFGGDTASLELRGFNSASGGAVGRIDFIQGAMTIPATNRNLARIEARKDSEGGGKLVFRTNDGSDLTSPMYIDEEGKVKISARGTFGGVTPAPTLLIFGNETDNPFYVRASRGGGLMVDSSGNVGIGTMNPVAELDVRGLTRTAELEITGGADIAEPFDIETSETIIPGMVVAIDPANPGKLKVSEKPYDRCVAGIVSGAGGVKPALTMMQQNLLDGAHPVALTGRVYALCDASGGAIEPGDLLTTSPTSGHAMKVTDYGKAQGAVLGKAMSRLKEGKGLVLVLVSLQ